MNKRWIDLRSDTVTMPSKAMRAVIADAEVGDDVYGEDPTVNRLEAMLAEMLGKEAALFLPSGTQSNFVALLTHCQRGDEYIVGQHAHTYKYEGGGAAVLGGIQPQPLAFNVFGGLDLVQVQEVIKPHDYHFARTRLLCLEDTMQGKVLPMDYLQALPTFAATNQLSLHLDGARLFNAAVALGVVPADISRHFDSVSVCLSKGLGAPAGSVLAGGLAFITEARRWRKVAGGGMRQAGLLAAGGIHALTHNIVRLADDHMRAAQLADALSVSGYCVEYTGTNMVFVDIASRDAATLARSLGESGIRVNPSTRLRLVTHMDISDADIQQVIHAFHEIR